MKINFILRHCFELAPPQKRLVYYCVYGCNCPGRKFPCFVHLAYGILLNASTKLEFHSLTDE